MVDLARGLREAGHGPLILVPRKGPLEALLTSHNLPFQRVNAKPWVGPFSAFKHWRRVVETRRGAREAAASLQGYDLVYTNTITSPFGGYLAKQLGLPNVWQIRENLPNAQSPRYSRRLPSTKRAFNELTTLSIGNSKHIVSQIEEWVGPAKARLVYSGPFDESETQRPLVRSAPPSPPYELLLLGRIAPEKRHEEAVRAVSILAESGLDVKLTIAGMAVPKYKQRIEDLARDMGISKRIVFLEYTPGTRAMYERSHVSLNCTLDEPLGRTILEAMAFGCPKVAANGGGTPEMIEHGRSGLLYTPGRPDQLADCIQQVLLSPSLADSIVKNAREAVIPKFTRPRYVRDTLAVFEEALALGR